MKTHLILLDGAKGAGKSTISGLLKSALPGLMVLDWGTLWRRVSDTKPLHEDDPIVLEAAVQYVRSLLNSNANILLDNHLTEKRARAFDLVGKECGVRVLKYHLTAPPEVLLERVRQRDAKNGQPTDEERFHAMHRMQQSKDFSEFKAFDTTTLSPEAIAKSIVEDVNKDGQ